MRGLLRIHWAERQRQLPAGCECWHLAAAAEGYFTTYGYCKYTKKVLEI